MNKSKFLKRSLAALLAILMVVAMVPSALAAQVVIESVPTARVFADPGYLISVGGDRAVWDEANGAYKVSTTFNEGDGVPANFKASMIEVDRNTVTVKEVDKVLGATVADLDSSKATQSVDSFGVGTYTYTLVAVVTSADGDTLSTNEYKLIIDLSMKAKSSDATIKAVKTTKLPYAISAKFDNANNTIDIVMALGKKTEHDNVLTGTASGVTAKDIFVPTSDTAKTVAYVGDSAGNGTGKVTVTAENGDTKIYAVKFTEETAFDTFKVGDFEGKAKADDPKVIFVDLPYSYYTYNTGGRHNDIDTTDINSKMLISWTIATGNKVFISNAVKESGKETLTFAYDSTASGDATLNGDGKYVLAKNDTLYVKTKKSAVNTVNGGEKITVYLRAPIKNPDAELTGIQIVRDNNNNPTDGVDGDYATQYIAIDKGTRTINIDLPTTVKNDNKHLFIQVWGADKSKIELAEGRTTSNAFNASATTGKVITTPIYSDTPIDVTKAITLKVVSEDKATSLLYTVNVRNTTGGTSSLTGLKLVDGDGKEVGTVSSIKNKDITVTLPYKYGQPAKAADLKGLKVVATGSSASNIGYANTHDIVAADYAGKKAQYSFTVAASGTPQDGDIIGGLIVKDDTTGQITSTDAAVPAKLAAALNANDKITVNGYTVKSVSGNTITIEADAIGVKANAPAKPTLTGVTVGDMTEVQAGENTATATVFTPFVKDEVLSASSGSPILGDVTITLPLASKDVDNDTMLADGTTPNPDHNPDGYNKFTLRVSNGTENGTTDYKITLKKADPNSVGTISSVKVADDSDRDVMNEYTATVNTRTGDSTSTIVVSQLPYSLKKAHETDDDMFFSELKLSDEAHALIEVGGTVKEMIVNEGTPANSVAFKVGTSSNAWSEKDNEIKVWVFSEKDWYANNYDSDKAASYSSENGSNATKTYKMSATYAAAETASDMTSIASTLDETVKVATASKTVTITIPNSYLDDDDKTFSLDIKTSPFAKVFGNAITGGTNSVAITPDKGDADTDGRSMFNVETNASTKEPELKLGASAAIKKFVIQSESTTNTTDYNVVVKVAPIETSNAIESITVAGQKATKGADGETWNLVLPADADLVQLVDVKTVSKLASVEIDSDSYDKDTYYDLGDDLSIKVTAENGDAFVYTLKTVKAGATTNTDITNIRAGAYSATKGTGNAWTIQVPEGTDMSNPSLTVTPVEGATVTSVNGAAYTAGMTVDLSEGKTLTIVVTAADGITTGTHTVTCKFGSTKPSDQYYDLPTNDPGALGWIEKAINYGIMSNTGSNADGQLSFGPDNRVNRKYFALMVARADVMAKDSTITSSAAADEKLKSLYSGTPAFTDAPANDDTVNAALEYCKENEIITGYNDGTFKPDNYISRTEAASIMVGWLKLPDAGSENTNNFNDWDAIGWAHGKVNSVIDAGVMSGMGDGSFGTGTLLRKQTAVILTRAFENLSAAE